MTAPAPEPPVPPANAVNCLDCDTIYRGETECPEEPAEHGYMPVYVTDKPLGRSDDADWFHHGRKDWVYDAETDG